MEYLPLNSWAQGGLSLAATVALVNENSHTKLDKWSVWAETVFPVVVSGVCYVKNVTDDYFCLCLSAVQSQLLFFL